MRTAAIAVSLKSLHLMGAGLFLLVFCAALLFSPKPSAGEGCGGAPQTDPASAYNRAAASYGNAALTEDPVWARYAKRGQAFPGCPEIAPLPPEAYSAPIKKRSVKARKNAGISPAAKKSSSAVPAQTKSTDNPCPPIIMPVPAIAVCADPALGAKN